MLFLTLFAELTGRVVGTDAGKRAIFNIMPERIDIFCTAQRWCAFEEASMCQHILIGHAQIVPTGLCRDIHAIELCFLDCLSDLRMADMADMHFSTSFSGTFDDILRCDEFCNDRA